jgi:hypothetical protein
VWAVFSFGEPGFFVPALQGAFRKQERRRKKGRRFLEREKAALQGVKFGILIVAF